MRGRTQGCDQAAWAGDGSPGDGPAVSAPTAPSSGGTAATAVLPAGSDLLQKIFEHSYDAIFVVDPAADLILDANPRACALLGYARDELLARPLSAVHPDGLALLRRFAEDATASGEGRTYELACVTRGGGTVAVEVSCSRIDLEGRGCLVCLARDVSERKRHDEGLRRDRERARRELVAAARIQESLLPHRLPAIPGIRTAWIFHPCQELAGDNLDIIPLGDNHVGLYVLDVSGHGVAAALLAVIAQRLLSPGPGRDSLLYRPRSGPRGARAADPARIVDPARVAQLLDQRIRPHLLPGQYLTLIYGVLDLGSREFRFASAGHWGPVHVPRHGPARLLHARGFPVGVMEDVDYEEHAVRLAPGDRLYLYSDGLPEATDPSGEQFDYPRILATLVRFRHRPLGAGLAKLAERVQEWRGQPRLEDDLSVLALEVDPGARARRERVAVAGAAAPVRKAKTGARSTTGARRAAGRDRPA